MIYGREQMLLIEKRQRERRGKEVYMAQQDYFLEIAMTKHPGSISDREIPPVQIPENRFRRLADNDADASLLQPEEDFEAQQERFRKELTAMRERYLPFMENHTPKRWNRVEKQELRSFRFRYMDKKECFTERFREDREWEDITIPDYRGPAGENGKWSGYYTCVFTAPEAWMSVEGRHIVLQFQCVDYIAEVYVNGNFAGRHEGFFAPFSFDITNYIKETNEITVLCRNDIPILGEGPYLDGDKIYAATGPGWDDAQDGWHHCPAGAGIFGRVTVELRPEIYLEDVFVRTDIDQDMAEVRVGVTNYTDQVAMHYQMKLDMTPRNYAGISIGSLEKEILCIGPGKNEYRFFLPVKEYRLWEPEYPWLYEITLVLEKEEGEISCLQKHFGIKRFVSDESTRPKGRFYLNGKPVMLRGANEMGHLQQCVMQGKMELLIDDILIAKMCHLNYYRVTQRPVQEEIYDYFDMLGIMHQCDLPLFSYLRRPQLAEALRQCVEMEHLIRSHVSTVIVTFINEPVCIRRTENPGDKFSKRYEAKGHRHLLRDELEAFFAAARKAIYTENPDRVIKNVEGDYDGPTLEGMPDFHTYTMWYTSHGQPIGKLMRGYLPPVKSGWMTGCGEYGAEGLDNENVMRERYPAQWLEPREDGSWLPDRIVRSQTHSVHGDWYPEQDNLADWVRESQLHQARATKLMTDAFRRRGDIINQTAIHLLIDAWPSGWMKTLVCCDRVPKRAYFAYQEALIPLKLSLYTGRSCVYEDEEIPVEVWLLNDTPDGRELKARAQVWEEGTILTGRYEATGRVEGASASCIGQIPVCFGQMGVKRTVSVTAALLDEQEQVLHRETISFTVFPRPVGWKDAAEQGLVGELTQEKLDELVTQAADGGRKILLLDGLKEELRLGEGTVGVKSCGDRFFVDALPPWNQYETGMLYNEDAGYIDTTADKVVKTELEGEAVLFTYGKSGFAGSSGRKPHLPVALRLEIGKGALILTTLKTEGRLGCNPGLDILLQELLRA